jgi:hypothetical protein
MNKLAILIPTLESRSFLLKRCMTNLVAQILHAKADEDVKILTLLDNGEMSTGAKRNQLVKDAAELGFETYAFIDDDDLPGPTYIQRGLEFVASGMDCASLVGQIYWDGKPGKPFLHSLEWKEWFEDDKFYYRMPNHLNFVRMDKVKDIQFPDQKFGEDGQWSYAVRDAGVLKTEFKIEEVIYHYFCGEPKSAL